MEESAALQLGEAALEAICHAAREGYPDEVCGLILGPEGDRGTEARAVRNTNETRAHDRYVMDPGEYEAVEREAAAAGLSVVGAYHTHPDHPSEPSETDRARAADVWGNARSWSYVILEVAEGGVRSWRSWVLEDGAFTEQRLEVTHNEEIRP